MRAAAIGRNSQAGSSTPLSPFDCPNPRARYHPALEQLSGERRAFIESEVVDARRQLAACGVPEGAIVGFRAPFLEVTPLLRRVLSDQGFLYDRWGTGGRCPPTRILLAGL